MTIAQQIRNEAEAANLTQTQLADKLGISPQYVSDIVRGRRGVSAFVAVRLERVLGIKAAYVLCEQALEELAKARLELGA